MTTKSEESNHKIAEGSNSDYSDYTGYPLCGAKAKSSGLPCRCPAMANGKCYVHGGKTPKHNLGPKTTEGRQRQRKANWKHGRYSQEHFRATRELREFMRQCKKELEQFPE